MIKGYGKKPKCSLTANIGLATQELSTVPIDDPTRGQLILGDSRRPKVLR